MAKKLKVSFLGGVGEIGKNLNVIEYDDSMIIVDCGISFGGDELLGIHAVAPDITYVLDRIQNLKGIFLTHGHEDHIGAICYFKELLKVPIYGTALTLAMLTRKLDKRGKKAKMIEVQENSTVDCDCFSVEFVKVAHSMAGACALSITTPVGVVFVTGDYKFDKSPIDKKKTNLKRIAEIGKAGVLLMLGESTNIEKPGSSTSEKIVGESLDAIFRAEKDKRIVVTTFASSNYRVQQVLWLAKKHGRNVLLCGKGMKSIVEIASEIGELEVPKGLIVPSLKGLAPEKCVILATGSQGEKTSALTRLSKGEFNKINLGTDDVVILSSTPIPGNEKSVYEVVNNLYKKGAKVIYEKCHDVHVSGHAYHDEIERMLQLVSPKYLVPVHGEYRHQAKHRDLAHGQGVENKNIFIPEIGDSYFVSQKSMKYGGKVENGILFVDDDIMSEGLDIISQRRNLAEFGILLILMSLDSMSKHKVDDIAVIGKGFNLTDEIEDKVVNTAKSIISSVELDKTELEEITVMIEKAVKKMFYKQRKFPVIIPIIVEG